MSVDAILQGQNYTTTEEDTLLADKAPTNHRSDSTSYGVGNSNYFGHVKIWDTPTTSYGSASGLAISPKGVQDGLDEKAPTNHRSTNNTYGVGNDTYFGHVKLWDTPTGVYGTGTGFAITPKGLQDGLDTKAPTNHRSSSDTYGTGNATYFGHVKLLTSHESTATVGEGIAATPLAVKQVYDAIPSAYTSTPKALGTASAGTSTSWARGDHVHALPSPADIGAAASGDIPTAYTSNPAQIASSASAGTSTSWARGDHVHKVASLAVLSEVLASDATPKTLGTEAAAGTFQKYSRADHVHKMPTPAEIGAATPGAIPSSYTATPAPLGTASAGTSTAWAKGDHVHKMPTKTELAAIVGSTDNPSPLSKTPTAGTNTALSREDHVHPTWYESFILADLAAGSTLQLNTGGTAHAILLITSVGVKNGASGSYSNLHLLTGYGSPTATSGTDFTQKRSAKTFATSTYVAVAGNQNGWSVTNSASSIAAKVTAIVLNGSVTIPAS